MTKISMILAHDEDYMIGNGDCMAWQFSPDLKHFAKTTSGAPVIVGPRTALGMEQFPLPNRPGAIISKSLSKRFCGAPVSIITTDDHRKDFATSDSLFQYLNIGALSFVLRDICKIIDTFSNYKEVFVAGGAGIYKSALATGMPEKIIRTVVPCGFATGDVYLDSCTIQMMSDNFTLSESTEYVLGKDNFYYIDKIDGEPFDLPMHTGQADKLKETDTPFPWYRIETLVRNDLYRRPATMDKVMTHIKNNFQQK